MAKIRGQYGQFAQIGNEERKVRSLRLTDSTWEALGQIAEEKDATRADLVEELATTYYTVSSDSQPSNTWQKELEELREWKARAESRLRESDGWQEQLSQLQRANLRNSGDAEKAEERAQSAESRVKELEEKLKAVEKERDELDRDCHQVHSEHGYALNQIETLKEQLANQQSEPTVPGRELPDKWVLKSRLIASHRLFKGKKPMCKIEAEDAQMILDLLEES